MSEVLGSSGLGFYGQDFFVIKTTKNYCDKASKIIFDKG